MRGVFYATPQQPNEDVPYGIDFAPYMVLAGEIITNADVTIKPRDSDVDVTAWMLVTGSVQVSSNTIVSFRVHRGSSNADYVATVRTLTNVRTIEGDESDVIIPVRERGNA